ncbi:hypothetical protein TIFTF001_006747 [Ficus carica]|uniref:Uncharacterized protein n=1 Tax=Ficus carica TaxID=3494 RepID=A0AA87ZNJ3_FICCA|nr:hypothetical protein TIFTF001_006747 [Ficus carica]
MRRSGVTGDGRCRESIVTSFAEDGSRRQKTAKISLGNLTEFNGKNYNCQHLKRLRSS